MLSNIYTIALTGINGTLVKIETGISTGIPKFEIVGLPDISIKESKERIIFAIKNSELHFPSAKVIVNLSPADVKKEGASYDLPIAIGILQTVGIIKQQDFSQSVFIGELGLDGKIKKVNGVLAMCIEAKKIGIKRIFLPKENKKEASFLKNIEIIPVHDMKELIKYLNGEICIKYENEKIEDFVNKKEEYNYKFEQIYGQENVKRALEIAVAGNHNCLIYGTPGTGKTILSKSIQSILPDVTVDEALEITKIYSVSGKLKNGEICTQRPFRSPHHSISMASMIGGGKKPSPGEITLAHLGVLYLDEIAEFKKDTLEALREPIEDKKIIINRVNYTVDYPCEFLLIASMNPCPCGYYGSKKVECSCNDLQRIKYCKKISGPFQDRIDLKVNAIEVEYKKIIENNNKSQLSSEIVKQKVNEVRKIQKERYKNENICLNSELNTSLIKKYCKIDKESSLLLEQAFKKFNLSVRGYNKILKVARTISDLDNEENIRVKHIAEAIQYRCQE